MKIYDLVKDLLGEYPVLRNSDKKLIWSVWIKTGHASKENITLQDFLFAPSTESIRRCRQKIQETCPELRGTKWVTDKRQEKEESKGTWIYTEKVVEQPKLV